MVHRSSFLMRMLHYSSKFTECLNVSMKNNCLDIAQKAHLVRILKNKGEKEDIILTILGKYFGGAKLSNFNFPLKMNGPQTTRISDLTDSALEILSIDELLSTSQTLLKSVKILEKDVEGYKNDSERLRRERNELRIEIEEVKKTAEVMEADRDRLNDELHDLKNELKDIKRESSRRRTTATNTPHTISLNTVPALCTPTSVIPVNKRPPKLTPVSSSSSSSSEADAVPRTKRSRMPRFDADVDTPYRPVPVMSHSTIECLPPPPPPVLTFTNFQSTSFAPPPFMNNGSTGTMNGTPIKKLMDVSPPIPSLPSSFSHGNYNYERQDHPKWGDRQGNQGNQPQQSSQYGKRERGFGSAKNNRNQNQPRVYNTGPPLLCGRNPEPNSLSRERAMEIADNLRPLTGSLLDVEKLRVNTKYHKCFCKPCQVNKMESPEQVVRHIFQPSHLEKVYYRNYAVSQDDFDYWKRALQNSQRASY